MKNLSVNVEKGFRLEKKKVHSFISKLIGDAGLKITNLEFNFVSAKTMIEINKKYLNHNYDTDIITFDYSDERNNLDGEIFISLPQAVANSKIYRVTIDNELLRLLIHGILHMIGFDDVTAAKRIRMKKVEDGLVYKYKSYAKGLIKKL